MKTNIKIQSMRLQIFNSKFMIKNIITILILSFSMLLAGSSKQEFDNNSSSPEIRQIDKLLKYVPDEIRILYPKVINEPYSTLYCSGIDKKYYLTIKNKKIFVEEQIGNANRHNQGIYRMPDDGSNSSFQLLIDQLRDKLKIKKEFTIDTVRFDAPNRMRVYLYYDKIGKPDSMSGGAIVEYYEWKDGVWKKIKEEMETY